MQDAVVVSVLQRGGHALHTARGLYGVRGMLAHSLLQSVARDVIHAEPRHALLLAKRDLEQSPRAMRAHQFSATSGAGGGV